MEARISEFATWFIQLPGWLLFFYLAIAQCLSALSYPLGVKMGVQEPASRVTEVGVAFWKGYAGADLVFYTPLLGIGLAADFLEATWSNSVLAAALGVTVYWPIACLWTIYAARGASGWSLPKERQYWIVLPIIASWGAASLFLLLLGVA